MPTETATRSGETAPSNPARGSSQATTDKGIPKLDDPRRARIEGNLTRLYQLIADRITQIQQICHTFDRLTHPLNSALRSLIYAGVAFLSQTKAVRVEQESRYSELALLASKDGPPIRLHSPAFDQDISALDMEIDAYRSLPDIWATIFTLPMTDDASLDYLRLRDIVDQYVICVGRLHGRIHSLSSAAQGQGLNEDTLYSPALLEMRQGNTWRDLRALSFGQRTGTILKLVLSAEGECVLLLDQPEDHLDNYSISKIIAPSIREIAVMRQVITITHSANLLLSMPAAAITVLASRGDNGYIKARGTLSDRVLIEEVLDILEGGVDTFYERLERYQSCIRTSLVGQVAGGAIGTIEAFFRRQTIEALRNDLQLFIGDRHALAQVASAFSPDYIRHEVPVHSIRDRVNEALQAAGTTIDDYRLDANSALVTKLCAVLDQLDVDINHLERTLNDISAFDGTVRPVQFDLGALIHEVHASIATSRQATVGSFTVDIDHRLFGYEVYADRYHLALVFRNLLRNAHKAIQLKMIRELTTNRLTSFIKSIRVSLELSGDSTAKIMYCDNGCGIDDSVRDRLYRVRCTTHHDPVNHGLGAQIIKGLLELNGGGIEVVSTGSTGTCQRIELPRRSIVA